MESNIYHQYILSFLEGDISPDERASLEHWLHESHDNMAYFKELQTIWIAAEAELQLPPAVIGKEWDRLEKQISTAEKIRFNWQPWLRIAAVFVLGGLFAWIAGYYYYNNFNEPLNECVVTAPLGAKTLVSLPDGTHVILNAGSVLRYAGDFGCNQREVTLDGEAFFEIAKDRSKLFMVHTSDVTVKAYGTKFNVKSYRDEKTIETTLVEGLVSVTRNSAQHRKPEELFLKPQEQLVFFKAADQFNKEDAPQQRHEKQQLSTRAGAEKILISKGIDPQIYIAWTEDRLIMQGEPFHKMVVKLERKFNVTFHFDDADLKEFRFSGIIENETLENVMAAITIAAPVEYTLKDREIWLRKKMGAK